METTEVSYVGVQHGDKVLAMGTLSRAVVFQFDHDQRLTQTSPGYPFGACDLPRNATIITPKVIDPHRPHLDVAQGG